MASNKTCMMPGCQKRAGYGGVYSYYCNSHPDGVALCSRHYKEHNRAGIGSGCPVCGAYHRQNQAEADRRNAEASAPYRARQDEARRRYRSQGYSGAALEALVGREMKGDLSPPRVTAYDIQEERKKQAAAEFLKKNGRKCPSCGRITPASQGVILPHTLSVHRHWDDWDTDPHPTCPGTGMLAEGKDEG
jgi:hypothetical protein